MIRDNIAIIEQQIEQACTAAGRQRDEVTLIAVSKTMPKEAITEVYQTGIRCFGENKAQEMMHKHDSLPEDIKWHMIGHLQRNKVKYVVGRAAMIHSVDSFRLAQEISREAVKRMVDINILLEVNVAMEESKYGLPVAEVPDMVKEIAGLPNIYIKGLMTVAPFAENPEDNRKYFKKLKELSVDITKKNIDNMTMDILSMGMTNDFTVAIEEGATHVRVGTGIFGERQYNTQ